jgi:hypothetical protein
MEKRTPRIKALLTPGEVAKRSGWPFPRCIFMKAKGL